MNMYYGQWIENNTQKRNLCNGVELWVIFFLFSQCCLNIFTVIIVLIFFCYKRTQRENKNMELVIDQCFLFCGLVFYSVLHYSTFMAKICSFSYGSSFKRRENKLCFCYLGFPAPCMIPGMLLVLYSGLINI